MSRNAITKRENEISKKKKDMKIVHAMKKKKIVSKKSKNRGTKK